MKYVSAVLACLLLLSFFLLADRNAGYQREDINPLMSEPERRDAEEEGYPIVLDPYRRTTYIPQLQIMTPVVTLNVREGDRFSEGDLLLQLDPVKFQAILLKAHAVLEKTKVELRTKERLYNDGTASYFEFVEAKANVEAAQAEVLFNEKMVEGTKVIAPYNGKVASLAIELYEVPLENREMITIVDDSILLGKALLPAALLGKIEVGQPVSIALGEGGVRLSGKLSRIAAVIDPISSTVKVEICIDNSEGVLTAGMTGLLYLKDIQKRATP